MHRTQSLYTAYTAEYVTINSLALVDKTRSHVNKAPDNELISFQTVEQRWIKLTTTWHILKKAN